MSIPQSIILGIIQGIAEWLPISSSGHLVIAQEFFGLQEALFFDILLHISTLAVVFFVFRKDIIAILKAIIRLNFKSEYGKLALFVILASVPTGIIGILFHDAFEKMFSNLQAVAVGLFITGIILLLTKRKKAYSGELSSNKALLVGMVQGIAIIPGISRSGSTISAGILSGVDKEKAARFSFLLSIPAILGAALMEFKNIGGKGIANINWTPIILGMIFAAAIGYIALKLLLQIIKSDKFYLFGYYCVGLSIILSILIFR